MPKSKHRKKSKAIPRKVVRRPAMFEEALDPFGLPPACPSVPALSGPISPDRLQQAEDIARAFAADDPEPIIDGKNPPTDPRVIAALGMV